MNMNVLYNDIFSYDPEEITTTLLHQQLFSYNGPAADFNREAITNWIRSS